MDINEFTRDQLRIINKAIANDLDVKYFDNSMLNPWQMREIYQGLLRGIDVSVYAKPEYTEEQMEFIREVLDYDMVPQNLIEKFLHPEFSLSQMREIYEALYAGIDPSPYLDVKFTSDEMYVIRCAMKEGLDYQYLIESKDLFSELNVDTEKHLLSRLHELRKDEYELNQLRSSVSVNTQSEISM